MDNSDWIQRVSGWDRQTALIVWRPPIDLVVRFEEDAGSTSPQQQHISSPAISNASTQQDLTLIVNRTFLRRCTLALIPRRIYSSMCTLSAPIPSPPLQSCQPSRETTSSRDKVEPRESVDEIETPEEVRAPYLKGQPDLGDGRLKRRLITWMDPTEYNANLRPPKRHRMNVEPLEDQIYPEDDHQPHLQTSPQPQIQVSLRDPQPLHSEYADSQHDDGLELFEPPACPQLCSPISPPISRDVSHSPPRKTSRDISQTPSSSSATPNAPDTPESEIDEETARREQWRVGKRPGHQGSFVKTYNQEKRGEKRTLNQSIENTAERVLKKPFRPPKIVLAKAKVVTPPPRYDRKCREASSSPLLHEIEPFPLSPKSTPTIPDPPPKDRLNRPFKTPMRTPSSPSSFSRSCAPTPSTSRTESATRTSNSQRSDYTGRRGGGVTLAASIHSSRTYTAWEERNEISKLENRARQLREALSLLQNPAQDQEVEALTTQWLEAGREMVERLFTLIPRPEPDPLALSEEFKFEYTPLSDEQRAFLGRVERDDDGNPVDSEGSVLMGEAEYDPEDVVRMVQDQARRVNWTRGGSNQAREVAASEWTYGTMMSKLGVDPALLGWNGETEDWD